MKKILLVFMLVLLSAVLVVSCDDKIDENSAASPSPSKEGEIITLGEKDGVGITWRVLKVDTEKKQALIISEDILDTMAMYGSKPTTEDAKYYLESDIRDYLNNKFNTDYGLDKSYMKEVDIESNIENTTIKEGGGDFVFLLSKIETEAGTNSGYYFDDAADRIAKYKSEAKDWWIRSEEGYISSTGNQDSSDLESLTTLRGIRPAFWYTWN